MAKRGNGEGTIYYSEKLKKWVGQFTAGRKSDGKLNRKSVYGDTRKEVKEKINKVLTDIQTNSFIDKKDIKLIDLTKQYVQQLYDSNKIKENTFIRKQCTINNIENLDIANKNIQDISITDINSSLSTLTSYAQSSINKIYDLISATFNYAKLLRIIYDDPFQTKGAIIKPSSKQTKKKVEALTLNEQKKLEEELKNTDDKYKDIIIIALYTGMRIGEILALEGKDIDIKNKTISVNKTLTKDINSKIKVGTTKTYSGTREIPFLGILLPIMTNLSNRKICFLNNGNYINHSTINIHFKKICKNADIKTKIIKKKKYEKYINSKTSDVNTHMLRHTFATRCIESGMSAVTLSRILGHKSINITLDTYTDIFNELKIDELSKFENYIKNNI